MNDPFDVVALGPDGPLSDPAPDVTYSRDIDLVPSWTANSKGIVGFSSGGWAALELAITQPVVERLVLVSLPFPDDDMPIDVSTLTTKTLVLIGAADPATGSSQGTRWQKALPNARLEMVPGGGHDILERMWPRVLSFLAPRRKRRD